MRDRSRAMSEVRSTLTGRVVDSYTNILTVKLFARARDEDDFVREAIDEHTDAFRRQLRMTTLFGVTLALMNASLVVGTGAIAIWLWIAGRIAVGAVAMALPLAWQIANMAGWVAQNVTAIFENVGVVQDGMRSIAVRAADAGPAGRRANCTSPRGAIRFEHVRFGYGTAARRAARSVARHHARRARRPGRPFRRRQIHAGQPAAAFLRSRSAGAS